MIVGHLNELNSYLSTNEYQASLGASKWIAIDLGTNISDITKLTWNGSPLSQEDAQEAISLGLDEGHLIFWARAEQLPKVIKIGRAGYADSEYKVIFVDAADYIEDENGHIEGEVGYYCQLYKQPLGYKPYKCKECLENKKYNKGD